jgi:hypothetical protein
MSSPLNSRRHLLALLAASIGLQAAMAAAPTPSPLYADPAHADLSGLWLVTGGFYFAPDRSVPKLLGEYKTTYARRTEAFNKGVAIDDMTADCLPAGMPHLLTVPYPFELMQTPGRVTFLYEYDSVVKADADRMTYHGDSYGRWEGDTLVVESLNVRDGSKGGSFRTVNNINGAVPTFEAEE